MFPGPVNLERICDLETGIFDPIFCITWMLATYPTAKVFC